MRRHQDDALEVDECVVESLNRLQVQVVGGRVEYHTVGVLEHHTGNHAAHFFTAGEDIGLLENLLAGEKHLAQKSAQEGLCGVVGELSEPVFQGDVLLEKFAVVLLKIKYSLNERA